MRRAKPVDSGNAAMFFWSRADLRKFRDGQEGQSGTAGAWVPEIAANIGTLPGKQVDVVVHGGSRNCAQTR